MYYYISSQVEDLKTEDKMNNYKELERLNYELQKCLIDEVIMLLEESKEKYKKILEGETNEYNG